MSLASLTGDGCRAFAAASPRRRGVVLHGYGGDGGEAAALAAALAERLEARVLVPDLPGHGGRADVPLSRESARAAVALLRRELGRVDFAVGHSLGARLALELEARARVLLAMPGAPSFEGSRRELVRTLRPGRVREAAPLAGLVELLASPPDIPREPTLLLTAALELETVLALAKSWEARGVERATIAATTHRDLIQAPAAHEAAISFLEARL